MTIHRIKKRTTPYVQIEKAAMEDRRLSWKAKGILVYLLSKKDDYVFYLDKLADQSTDGIDSLRSGIKELQEFGYVNRYPIKDKGKIVSWGLDVYESPDGEKPYMEKPHVENPMLLINKDLSNKDLSNNKTYITLKSDVHIFIKLYLEQFEKMMNKKHPRVTDANYDFIINQIQHLESWDVSKEQWKEEVIQHLNNLPKSNNGSILPFLRASNRLFDVDIYNQFYP